MHKATRESTLVTYIAIQRITASNSRTLINTRPLPVDRASLLLAPISEVARWLEKSQRTGDGQAARQSSTLISPRLLRCDGPSPW